ncbi:hypothetical protein H6P81_014493 [Aristolochia fimbriata]|uniref:ABC transporter C family member 10 n=1 Tax=Aristolochia fimbriata TaxID=158543 RepID=A0AAV7EHP6_ARIFI|nr:hypothetical protein H6P81_014493 [Aristolochia fimbriata]
MASPFSEISAWVRRVFFATIVLLLLLDGICVGRKCEFEAIFNFGDSNSETGGFWAAFPPQPSPFGITYFKKPSGRASDGRAVIDFLAQALGLPFLSPYLQSIDSNYRHGVNYATAASTVLLPETSLFVSGISPFSLAIQLNQMKAFKAQVLELHSQGKLTKRLPPPDVFGRSLYTIDIGQNDFTSNLANLGIEGVKQYLPQVVSEICQAIEKLYAQGGRTFLVFNLAPIGCFPAFLTELPHTSSDLDEFGCMISYNNAVIDYNEMLKEKLHQTRKLLPEASLIYVDTHSIKLKLFQNPSYYGLKYGTRACCGNGGGSYNFDKQLFCGNSRVINGSRHFFREVYVKVFQTGRYPVYKFECNRQCKSICCSSCHSHNQWPYRRFAVGIVQAQRTISPMNYSCSISASMAFCGVSNCTDDDGKSCNNSFLFIPNITRPNSCLNHILIISVDIVLILMLLFQFLHKTPSRAALIPKRFRSYSPLHLFTAFTNCCLGLAYLGLGIWILEESLSEGLLAPLHPWLAILIHGLVWMFLSLTIFLKEHQLPRTLVKLWSAIVCIFAGFLCVTSVLFIVTNGEVSMRTVLDIISLPGAIFLAFCIVRDSKHAESSQATNGTLYMPLNGHKSGNGEYSKDYVTPFASAGFLSRMSFWCWLRQTKKKSCYILFQEQLNRQRLAGQSRPSILWTLLSCHLREIFVSGFFALLKILTVSAGPVLLNAFIKVAEGRADFKYEGYLLAGGLFLAKCLESLSQRQWYFRSRLIGVRVRSLLSAAIYHKQLRLSNRSRMLHSAGEIINYVTVDAYRIGEFPFWFHQTWTTSLQLCIALVILYHAVGLATISALMVIVFTVICNTPLAKLQHKFQTKLMEAQDKRLKATSEALMNMKILKLYAWESHFKNFIENLRNTEYKWLSAVQLRKAYNSFLFWCSPVLVSAATFGTCYLIHVPLYASNVFTFIATLRLVQDPVRSIPDVIGVVIQAKVALARIVRFLEAPELQNEHVRNNITGEIENSIVIKSCDFSWEDDSSRPALRHINLEVKPGGKVAICGEVGSGKSTLLAAILGEIPNIIGMIQVQGKLAYVSQTAWIQTGTIQDNILFGAPMDQNRYQEVVNRCSLAKDLEMLPFGDLTEIGERGVNLSGGQKQRIQLARAVYQNADIYLLDDPFSAVDAHTATSLFNECIMGCLLEKTVLLVTHQVDFLPAFNSVLLMSNGVILHAAPYSDLLASSKEFQELVIAHKETAGAERIPVVVASQLQKASTGEIKKVQMEHQQTKLEVSTGEQLIKQEEKESGDTGLRPYVQYLCQNKGYLYFSCAALSHVMFVAGQIIQNSWMAANVQNPAVSNGKLISIYLAIGCTSACFLFLRSVFAVVLGLQSSKSLFSQLINSLFRAPMSFYDSTPLGRILSRVSSDLSIVDLDLPFSLIFTTGSTVNAYSNLGVLAVVTWQVLFVSIPVIYFTIRLQRYYFASAKEFMRINGTTKSFVTNHLAESISGAMTIRAFEEEDRFFSKNLSIIDRNASPFFHNFAANEWLIQRLETMSAMVLSSSALAMTLLPKGTFSSGFIGMALSYGLSLNMSLVFSIQNQCTLANYIISVERLNQYMHIPSESSEVIETNRPAQNWPTVGKVEILDLQIRYRSNIPLVLRGITCTFGGGEKIGIVGRTGSGKSTLIGALFRLVEPAGGKIVIDGIDISMIGLHDLRSRLGVIPQDPTLFHGTVRFNLDPLSQHTDHEIWEVLLKCQLHDAVKEKENGLDSLVTEDGSNWSMGQRQLFCLGRALLRRCKILVLDEATASVDNATDSILQKKIRTEFADCTVITVAHRIPTVMDCNMVLALSDGKIVEYDEPMELMKKHGSLFGELVKEYWSRTADATIDSTTFR